MSAPPPTTAPAEFPPPPPERPAHVSEGFAWWAPFAALVCAYAVAIVFVAILAGATGATDGGDLPAGVTLVATFVQDLLLILAMVGFARLTGALATPAAFGLRRAPIWPSLKVAALAFVVFYGFLLAWSRLDPSARDDLAEELGAKSSTLALVAVGVLVVLVAPIVEELFFRGFLFGALRRVMGWVPAAALGGLVFGGVHVGGTPLIFLVPLMLLGFLLCALYQRTRSLLPGMGVHAFNNGVAFGVSVMSWSVGGSVLAAGLAAVAVVSLASRVAE